MPSALDGIRESWDKAAKDDPLWNILTISGKEHGQWDPEEFFETGADEIAYVIDRLDGLGVLPGKRDFAMDFGCGVGRLSQALATFFTVVHGVDVSPEMVALADKFAVARGRHDCFFETNKQNLGAWDSGRFDLIYTTIVLQHMPHDMQRTYIGEFMRVLHNNGVLVFQLPEGPGMENGHLSMYGTGPTVVSQWVEKAGGEIVDVELTDASGYGWQGWRYTVVHDV